MADEIDACPSHQIIVLHPDGNRNCFCQEESGSWTDLVKRESGHEDPMPEQIKLSAAVHAALDRANARTA